MDTKLTLTIDEKLIDQVKHFAHQNKRSVSDLVENYFRLLVAKQYEAQPGIPDVVQELKGSFQAPDDFDYEQVLDEAKKKKLL
jgi:hypothetical protein